MMKREGDRVIIDIGEEEFETLLRALGYAVGAVYPRDRKLFRSWLNLSNVINEGNPLWAPYDTSELLRGERPLKHMKERER